MCCFLYFILKTTGTYFKNFDKPLSLWYVNSNKEVHRQDGVSSRGFD